MSKLRALGYLAILYGVVVFGENFFHLTSYLPFTLNFTVRSVVSWVCNPLGMLFAQRVADVGSSWLVSLLFGPLGFLVSWFGGGLLGEGVLFLVGGFLAFLGSVFAFIFGGVCLRVSGGSKRKSK